MLSRMFGEYSLWNYGSKSIVRISLNVKRRASKAVSGCYSTNLP